MLHKFGGNWTQIKLDSLEKYLNAYLKVMKNQSFQLIYIDAFAGTGECTTKDEEALLGSVARALNTNGFDKYIFIEKDEKRHAQLVQFCRDKFPDRNVSIQLADANKELRDMFSRFDSKNWRGVLFLDPYGMSVEWSTLKVIAKTRAIDVWYLFPLAGLFRNAARNWENVDKSKEQAIDRILGTDEWKTIFYSEHPQSDLFSDDSAIVRSVDLNYLERYVTERLNTIFPAALEPRRLCNGNIPLFSLYFAISNDSKRAQDAAIGIANYILKNT
jgi:three-Cys-motif partner protein